MKMMTLANYGIISTSTSASSQKKEEQQSSTVKSSLGLILIFLCITSNRAWSKSRLCPPTSAIKYFQTGLYCAVRGHDGHAGLKVSSFIPEKLPDGRMVIWYDEMQNTSKTYNGGYVIMPTSECVMSDSRSGS
jgi:hypothetical protein